jgi:hypothetical protein
MLPFLQTGNARAGVSYWKNGVTAGNWSNGNNWSAASAAGADNAGVPGVGAFALISHTDGVPHTIAYDYTGPPVSLAGLNIDLTGGVPEATTTFTMAANSLSSSEIVGVSGSGTFIQTGGTNTASSLSIGFDSGSNGTYALGGSGSLTADVEYIGRSGTGMFNHSSGTNTIAAVAELNVGNDSGSNGTYNLSGTGSLTANHSEIIGRYGTGMFNHSSGTNTTTSLFLGYEPGSSGTYTLSGTGLLISKTFEWIGAGGVGTFNQSGGAHFARRLDLGVFSSTGYYNLSGTGSLIVGGSSFGDGVSVGSDGAGVFNQSGGTHTIFSSDPIGGGFLILANNASTTGTYILSSGTLTANEEIVGNRGMGTFNQTGGANTINYLFPTGSALTIGSAAGSIGVYTLSGTASLTVNGRGIVVGGSGTGTFNHSGGSNTISRSGLIIGSNSGSVGVYTLSGTGSLTTNGSIQIGIGGTGTFNQTGGNNTIIASFNGGLYIGAFAGSVGTYNQTGGTNTITANGGLYIARSAGSTGTYLLSGGTTTTDAVHVGGWSFGPGGNGNLTISGSGKLSVVGTLMIHNSPGSATTFNGGTIDVGSIVNQGTFTVNKGTLSVSDVTLNSTSILDIGLGGLSRGSEFGAIPASGNVSLAGSLVVSLNAFTPAAGNSFDILDWGNLTGTFSTLQLPALSAGLMWNTSQLYTAGILNVTSRGDYNGDGIVNTADYTVWRNSLGQTGAALAADGNGNNMIDADDYGVWKMHFGETVGGASLASNTVPEPDTLMMLLVVMLAMISVRRTAVS